MVRKTVLAAFAAALGLIVAGAGTATATPSGGVSVRSAPPSFPITLKAANGYVRIERRPVRIVSLSPTATESLFAIDAGTQVVAVDDQSNYPASAPRTKLSGYRPNAEAVAAYQPDLVVTSSSANALLPALEKLEIPVLLEPAARSLGDAYVQIRQLGFATGHDGAARALIRQMKAAIAKAVRGVPRGRALSVYHELSPDYYSATSRTFIGRAYALFGLRNIADEAGRAGNDYPQLSGEYVLAANPDLIVLSDTKCCGQSAATVRDRPGWSSLSAVRNGRVLPVSDDIASRWGPRIVQFVQLVGRAVARARS
jgi:iron complex transport system substrate-binding protein